MGVLSSTREWDRDKAVKRLCDQCEKDAETAANPRVFRALTYALKYERCRFYALLAMRSHLSKYFDFREAEESLLRVLDDESAVCRKLAAEILTTKGLLSQNDNRVKSVAARNAAEDRARAIDREFNWENFGGPAITCTACGKRIPQRKPGPMPAYWIYEGMFCTKCQRRYCDRCEEDQFDRDADGKKLGIHKGCGGRTSTLNVAR